MKQYTFVLNFGYVESTKLSYMPFTSVLKYKDAKTALADLASFLKEQYEVESVLQKKCCIASRESNSDLLDDADEFCGKCGLPLEAQEFDEERFASWLCKIADCNIDSFHGDYISYSDHHRWNSNGLEDAPNQRFVYQAEWVLTAAVGYPHRTEITFDDLCARRTKKKEESFTYYG